MNEYSKGLATIIRHPNPVLTYQKGVEQFQKLCHLNGYPWAARNALMFERSNVLLIHKLVRDATWHYIRDYLKNNTDLLFQDTTTLLFDRSNETQQFVVNSDKGVQHITSTYNVLNSSNYNQSVFLTTAAI
jgi:hypothetical protein